MGIAIVLAKRPSPSLRGDVQDGREPRAEYLELAARTSAEIIDFHDVERSSDPIVRAAAARGGALWGLAALAFRRRRELDHLYLTGEDIGLRLGALLRAARERGRVTAVFHQVDTPRRRAVVRLLGDGPFARVIVLAAAQREVFVRQLGFPPEKVALLHNWLDHRFFAPPAVPAAAGDEIVSVGMESRDYPTLQAAMAGLPFRLHVVASGWSPGAGYGPAAGISAAGNVTVGRGYDTRALRDLYARARFAVVPLKRVPYAAGVTAVLEAMAMGKAVVTTDSPGISDYARHGENALVVPAGDVEAMRAALRSLWEHPELAAELGARGRRRVEQEWNTDDYVERVAALLTRSPAPRTSAARAAP